MAYKPFKMKGSPMKRNFGIDPKDTPKTWSEINRPKSPVKDQNWGAKDPYHGQGKHDVEDKHETWGSKKSPAKHLAVKQGTKTSRKTGETKPFNELDTEHNADYGKDTHHDYKAGHDAAYKAKKRKATAKYTKKDEADKSPAKSGDHREYETHDTNDGVRKHFHPTSNNTSYHPSDAPPVSEADKKQIAEADAEYRGDVMKKAAERKKKADETPVKHEKGWGSGKGHTHGKKTRLIDKARAGAHAVWNYEFDDKDVSAHYGMKKRQYRQEQKRREAAKKTPAKK